MSSLRFRLVMVGRCQVRIEDWASCGDRAASRVPRLSSGGGVNGEEFGHAMYILAGGAVLLPLCVLQLGDSTSLQC